MSDDFRGAGGVIVEQGVIRQSVDDFDNDFDV